MKLLIIPDVHNRVEWAERLILRFPDRQAVFLGDYFDSYDDDPTVAEHTAHWLRFSIEHGRIHLLGNHDLPYRWQGQTCPGYTREKHRAVLKHMQKREWDQTRMALIYRSPANEERKRRPLVLSHAGFTLANLYGVQDFREVARDGRCAHLRKRSPSEHLQQIRMQARACLMQAELNQPHFWFNQGTRMGERNVGGPFWIDRHQLNFPLPGVDQIVGHTHVDKPQRSYVPNYEVWFIDGGGRLAALVDDPLESNPDRLLITPIHASGPAFGEPWKQPEL